MSQRLLRSIFAAALFPLTVPAMAGDGPHNILVLIADDLGVDILDVYGLGTNRPSTPNIDALARDGVVFENAWSSPVCSPARACMMTGRYGFRTGVGTTIGSGATTAYALPLDEITIPEMLDQGTGGAYAHAAIGKWHLGNKAVGGDSAPNLAGFSHFSGMLDNLTSFYGPPMVINGVRDFVSGYATSIQVNEALRWVSTAQEPWFMQVAFNAPHKPYHAPPDGLYTVDLSTAGPPSQDPRPYYNAMVEAMDTEIGRLLNGLGSSLGNTTVLFIGDNGTVKDVILPPFNPNHGKLTVYDGGVNVPLIVSGAAVTAPGSRSNALTHAVDVYATVADLAGVDLSNRPRENQIDGHSLRPFLHGLPQPSAHETVIAEKFLPNGEVNGLLPAPIPGGCQPDLGYQGPGNVRLDVCGGPLNLARRGVLTASNAPPQEWALLISSTTFNPTPSFGGMLTPMPWLGATFLVTDAAGTITVNGLGTNPLLRDQILYLQLMVHDPSQPQDIALSNTVAAHFLPISVKAIRDGRYKVILRIDEGQPDEFYDLWLDPFEANNLSENGMTPAEQARFDQLRDELLVTISSETRQTK